VIAHLSTLLVSALKAPEVKSKLPRLGLAPVGRCGADFAADVRKQYDEYGRAIREANIKAEMNRDRQWEGDPLTDRLDGPLLRPSRDCLRLRHGDQSPFKKRLVRSPFDTCRAGAIGRHSA
jgi:hypothetical protein